MKMNKYNLLLLFLFFFYFFINTKQITAEDALEFSARHGFYENNFEVTITSTTPGEVIKYTLDGSDPRTSLSAIQKNSPALISIDPESTEGQRGKTPGVVLRACTVAQNNSASEVITQTYLFVNKIISLSKHGIKPGPNWPNPTTSSNPQYIDYGMDPDVYNDIRYKDLIDDALLSIPSISIVTDLKNLFDTKTGIYMNADNDGITWERPASIELLNPDDSEGFQINAGIRIRGGASRTGGNPKHAFRIFFRSEYGKDKLKYPLFGDEGVDEFDKIDLRTSQNYAWSFPGHQGEYNIMNRDVFSRDLQREMGQPYTRSRYYHLYINGVYWGLYQTQERPEARFAASYLGGEADEYDVIKAGDDWNAPIISTDGNLDAYRSLWNYCKTGFKTNEKYFEVQGLNTNGIRNPSFKVLVDVDNLIDFMLAVFYAGNFDCPITIWSNNKSPRNFYGIYSRIKNDGFRFFVHDAEHSLRTTPGEHPSTVGVQENRVNLGYLTNSFKMTVSNFENFHPQWLHHKLSENAEYKMKFADHIYTHFFNEGCITPSKTSALFSSRAKEIDMAIIAESARWGDTYYQPARTKDDDWKKAVDDITYNYFPKRTEIVLNQLKAVGLYPKISPPMYIGSNQVISSRSMKVAPGYKIKIKKENDETGTIKYTIDGQDPRLIGGGISSSAIDGESSVIITINSTTVIKARLLNGSDWSALHEITLFVDDSTSLDNLKITEIHYHPLDNDSTTDNKYEFLELKNIGETPIDLSGYYFESGIEFTFPDNMIINSKGFIVLCSNRDEFNNRYGFYAADEYAGQLDNSGEKIILCKASGDTILSVDYSDKTPWPVESDGIGYSLVTTETNPTGNLNDPVNWRSSYKVHGSPGADDLQTTDVEQSKQIIRDFVLHQNYPNPFNPSTQISYNIPVGTSFMKFRHVTLKVYDVLGRVIATLVDEEKSSGSYRVNFDATGLPSGIYYYRIESENFIETKKMVFLK